MLKKRGELSTEKFIIISLLQIIAYTVIWLWNEYVATYITIIFPVMILLILILSTIANLIEPARIPRWYYLLMLISVVIPLLIGIAFYILYEGRLDFLEK